MNLFAYLDAGTGSVVIQALIGVGVAATVVLKTNFHRIKKFLTKKSGTSEDVRSNIRTDKE